MKTLTDVDAALNELDSDLVGDVAAQALFVSHMLKTGSESELMKFGFDKAQLRVVIERYRKSGIWNERKGVARPKNDIDFYLIINVGRGEFVRAYSKAEKAWVYFPASLSQQEIDSALISRASAA